MTQTVLLIDDEANVLYGMLRTLRHQPYNILTARNANEAMWILKTRSIDAIVSDEHMPGMSGTEFCTWVADNYPNVARIILTGHATLSAALRAINGGRVYRFLTKPCNELELSLTIRQALEERERHTDSPSITPSLFPRSR